MLRARTRRRLRRAKGVTAWNRCQRSPTTETRKPAVRRFPSVLHRLGIHATRDVTQLVCHPVGRDRWQDLQRLFEGPGGPKHCWCMIWRPLPRGASHSDSSTLRDALAQRVQQGEAIGILGYLDGEPVAWTSIAPRSTYLDLGGKQDAADAPECVWSLVCFFVLQRLQGLGITKHLIQAAVTYARRNGATAVEAYPVDPDSPSLRSMGRFMGVISSFKAAGFQEVGLAGSDQYVRHVMRLKL